MGILLSFGLFSQVSPIAQNVYGIQVKNGINPAITLNPSDTATANEGAIYYDSDDNHFYGYNGSNWVQLDNGVLWWWALVLIPLTFRRRKHYKNPI